MAFYLFLSLCLALLVFAAPNPQTGIAANTLSNVRARLLESANASWELGTAAEALTELTWPSLCVFHPGSIPPRLNKTVNASDVLSIAAQTIKTKPSSSMALVANDGAVGDPASIGVAILLANWTRQELSDVSYSNAATDQLNFLIHDAPRSSDGAISHRTDQVQLWADFVYMAPPFIAYYGALQGGPAGLALLQTAYQQIQLYRTYLRDNTTSLWRHVALGSWQDNTLWATGNGWAAAGMFRVLETIQLSSQAHNMIEEQRNLTNWITEIVDAVWTHQQENGTLFNDLTSSTSFADSSSTALLASVTYRLAALSLSTEKSSAPARTSQPVTQAQTQEKVRVDAAHKAFALVESSIDTNGWLQNTVDPYTFNTPTSGPAHSPEGQAFVLLMQAAHRDWIAAGGS